MISHAQFQVTNCVKTKCFTEQTDRNKSTSQNDQIKPDRRFCKDRNYTGADEFTKDEDIMSFKLYIYVGYDDDRISDLISHT